MFKFRLCATIFTALLASNGAIVSATTPPSEKKEEVRNPDGKQEKVIPIEGLPKVWLQGKPVEKWEKDKVYIFEFWATWCGPCLAAMPHMEDLHHAFKDNPGLQIVGINVMDRKKPEELKAFLKARPSALSYTMAVDTEGNTSKNWLTPLGVTGIPHAFGVKNGKLIWRGHPATLTAGLLKNMLTPEFEVTGGTLPSPSEENTTFLPLKNSLHKLLMEGKQQEAAALIQDIEKKQTLPEARIIYLKNMSFEILSSQGKYQDAQTILHQLAKDHPDDYNIQMSIAVNVMNSKLIPAEQKDIKLAEQCLQRGIEISKANNREASLPWQKLAQLKSQFGNPEAAVECMEKALQLSSLGKAWEDLQKRSGKNEPLLPILKTVVSTLPAIKDRHPQVLGTVQEHEQWSPLFGKLHWNQEEKPTGLPLAKTTIINFSRAQSYNLAAPGGSPSSAALDAVLSRANLLEHPTIKVITLITTPIPDSKASKYLALPEMKSPYPLGIPTDGAVEQILSSLSIDSLPASVVIRDGIQIWDGETKRMPEWVLETASRENFDKEVFAKEEASRKAQAEEMKAIITRAFALKKEKKEDEYLKLLEEHAPRFADDSWYLGLIAETQAGNAFKKQNYKEATSIFDKLLTQFPKDSYTASYVMKFLESSEELKPHSYAAMRHALQIMHDSNLRSDPGYNAACHEVMMMISMEQKNYSQAREDAIAGWSDLPLVTEYAAMLGEKTKENGK